MISSLSSSLRDFVNLLLRQRGYSLRWIPRSVLLQNKTIEIDFEFLAAHLMLKIKKPYFIGIGANDGVTHDPIFPFVRDFGWEGIMVEPLPEAFAALQRNYALYKNVKLVQAAVDSSDGTGLIYTVNNSDKDSATMSLHSSLNKDILLRGKKWHPNLEDHIITKSVTLMSFSSLIAKTKGSTVDILKIDTEGHDLKILRSINFSQFSPSLILAEHANLSRNEKIEMADILLKHGYKVGITSLDMLGYKRSGLEHG